MRWPDGMTIGYPALTNDRQLREQIVDFRAIIDSIIQKIEFVTGGIGRFFEYTGLQEQLKEVDVAGLFANPWFLVPFIVLIGYLMYKKAFRDLFILGLLFVAWWASGTHYMQTLVVNGELQITKILPVLFGGAAMLGFIIYLFLGRSD